MGQRTRRARGGPGRTAARVLGLTSSGPKIIAWLEFIAQEGDGPCYRVYLDAQEGNGSSCRDRLWVRHGKTEVCTCLNGRGEVPVSGLSARGADDEEIIEVVDEASGSVACDSPGITSATAEKILGADRRPKGNALTM